MATTTTPDVQALKDRHRATWAAGDYEAVAERLVLEIGDHLVARMGLGAGDEVLDVAAQKAAVERIQITRTYTTALPEIWVDVPHLKTCFMNLVLNAFQAMPDGGAFRVTAAGGAPPGESAAGESADGWLEIRFQDSGMGIKPEDLPKVFEPYFTTKEVGIGLGLALTKQIVEEHGGQIEISSDPGQGTAVRLRLPVGAPKV